MTEEPLQQQHLPDVGSAAGEDANNGSGGFQLAMATMFSVAQAGDDELVIKQEPQDPIPDESAPEIPSFPEEEEDDEELDEDLHTVEEEVSPVILQRAVSPPTYVDPSEQRIEELTLYYKNKYQLQDVTVELESCDKIWETLKLIKDIQSSFNDDDDSCSETSLPKNSSTNEPKLPGPLIPYQPMLGNNNKALPDFRFSVKSKKKLYHCITCGKEYVDSNHLRQHAIDEHGVFVNPKRVYKPRADFTPKPKPVISDINKDKPTQVTEPNDEIPVTPTVITPVETVPIVQPQIKTTEGSVNNNSKIEQPPAKIIASKDKIKCVLCKRICTDIVYHMKGYHKVGCITSIIAQCEKISADNVEAEKPKEIIPEPEGIDLTEPLAVAVKKRKRNMPRWTIPKKRSKFVEIPTKLPPPGPFKCNVCLGMYKSYKSFNYHKRIHQIRGETPQNFDPTKCRFLNSPLRPPPKTVPGVEVTEPNVPIQKEIVKSQSVITNYVTVEKQASESHLHNEEAMNDQDMNMEMNDPESERTCCECGRSFRNYHTMFLHKVKCKGIIKGDKSYSHSGNDADSGIGISIKIKKNKNDSYEVVPRHTPVEENYKDSRSSKDSDASSNDSGMVCKDYSNNQKLESAELSKYGKSVHSICRIQVAEDDEEVDIEDEDTDNGILNEGNDSNLNSNHLNDTSQGIIGSSVENKFSQPNSIRSTKSETKENSVPSLTNLCKKVLSQSKIDKPTSIYKCQTCSEYFRNKTELMEHAALTKHNVKSICPCGKKFKNLKVFNIHVKRYHPLLLNCNYCKTHFDRIEKYTEHKCEVLEGDLFIEPIIQTECSACKILVDIGEPFDKHMKTHYPDSPVIYQCFKCELKFENQHQRRSHFSKEHGSSVCRICDKVIHIDYLSKHEAYHEGLGHPCHLCKKSFSQKTLLKKHVQGIHDPTVNQTIKCIVCSKSIKLKYLKKHMSFHLHTEICRKCNKCCPTDNQKNLEDHIAIDHPNDYPMLKCDTCNTTFVSDNRYEEHRQNGTCKTDDVKDTSIVVHNTTSSN